MIVSRYDGKLSPAAVEKANWILCFLEVLFNNTGVEYRETYQFRDHTLAEVSDVGSVHQQGFKQVVESGLEFSNYLFDAVGYKKGRVLDQAYLPYAAIPLFLKHLKSKKK